MSIDRVTDADLVARARQGDPAAFGELVDRHQSAVYRAALAALGSHADAEDAAQEAFLAAHRRLGTFRGDASFKTWLLTIAWHQAINRRRSVVRAWRRLASRSTGGQGDERDEADLLAAPDASPEDAAAYSELCRAIRSEIHALAPKLRDPLLLAQSGEYKYQEIAAMLKAPVGTVKWRISEARRVIRQRLGEHGHERIPHG